MDSQQPSITLHLSKFLSLLEKHGFLLSAVYTQKGYVRFAECRTPRQQKTFVVYLPPRYAMRLTDGSTLPLKRFNLRETEVMPSSRQLKYIIEMKGPLLECNLLSVSSQMVCMYRDGQTTSFAITEDEEDNDEDGSDEEDEEGYSSDDDGDDDISHLERGAQRLLDRVDPEKTIARVRYRDKPLTQPQEDSEEENSEGTLESISTSISQLEVVDETPSGPIELIFADRDGEPIDDVKSMLEKGEAMASSSAAIDPEELNEFSTPDNALPPEMEESDIILGIIYILTDIGVFFRQITHFEQDAIQCYDQINKNQIIIRKDRLRELKKITEEFLIHAEKRIEGIHLEERKLKIQLIRLTVILSQTESLRDKVGSDPGKYGEVVSQTEEVYLQTRQSIYELNLQLLKFQDTADELLTNYDSSLRELISL